MNSLSSTARRTSRSPLAQATHRGQRGYGLDQHRRQARHASGLRPVRRRHSCRPLRAQLRGEYGLGQRQRPLLRLRVDVVRPQRVQLRRRRRQPAAARRVLHRPRARPDQRRHEQLRVQVRQGQQPVVAVLLRQHAVQSRTSAPASRRAACRSRTTTRSSCRTPNAEPRVLDRVRAVAHAVHLRPTAPRPTASAYLGDSRQVINGNQPNEVGKLQYSNSLNATTFITAKYYRVNAVSLFDYPYDGANAFFGRLLVTAGRPAHGLRDRRHQAARFEEPARFRRQVRVPHAGLLAAVLDERGPRVRRLRRHDRRRGLHPERQLPGYRHRRLRRDVRLPALAGLHPAFARQRAQRGHGAQHRRGAAVRRSAAVRGREHEHAAARLRVLPQGHVLADGPAQDRHGAADGRRQLALSRPATSTGACPTSFTTTGGVNSYQFNYDSDTRTPRVWQPRLAVAFQATRNDAFRASYGRSVQFAPIAAVDLTTGPYAYAAFKNIPSRDPITGTTAHVLRHQRQPRRSTTRRARATRTN